MYKLKLVSHFSVQSVSQPVKVRVRG